MGQSSALKIMKKHHKKLVLILAQLVVAGPIILFPLDDFRRYEVGMYAYWTLGGPVLVATWNIYRIYFKKNISAF